MNLLVSLPKSPAWPPLQLRAELIMLIIMVLKENMNSSLVLRRVKSLETPSI